MMYFLKSFFRLFYGKKSISKYNHKYTFRTYLKLCLRDLKAWTKLICSKFFVTVQFYIYIVEYIVEYIIEYNLYIYIYFKIPSNQ
jgi:hypothetical protein